MALQFNAATFILCRNHSLAEFEPDAAVQAPTPRLQQALALLDIRVLNHLVVGGNRRVSVAARRWV